MDDQAEPEPEPPPGPPRFETHLWGRFDTASARVKAGVRSIKLVAAVLQEQAAREEAYGAALVQLARSHAPPPPAAGEEGPSSLEAGWAALLAALGSVGKQHIGFSVSLSSSIVQALDAYGRQVAAEQQEQAAAGRRATGAIDEVRRALDRAHKRLAAAKAAALAPDRDASPPEEPEGPTREEDEGEGLRRFIDSVTPTRGVEEDPQDEYDAAVRAANEAVAVYDVEMTRVLSRLQEIEEARLGFLAERLGQLEVAYAGLRAKTAETEARLDEAAAAVSGERDGEAFAARLAGLEGADCVAAAARGADAARRATRAMHAALSELVGLEDAYARGLHKLLRGHGFHQQSSSHPHFAASESGTLRAAWTGVARRLAQTSAAHRAFARRAADPSLALLAHVEAEHAAARKNLLGVHARAAKELANFNSTHSKAKARYERQCKELQEKVESLERAREELRQPHDPVPDTVLQALGGHLGLTTEPPELRVPKLEAKVAATREARDASEQHFVHASTALAQQQDAYAACVDTVRSGFRLSEVGRVHSVRQVLEQMAAARGELRAALPNALDVVVDVRADVAEFIMANVQPRPPPLPPPPPSSDEDTDDEPPPLDEGSPAVQPQPEPRPAESSPPPPPSLSLDADADADAAPATPATPAAATPKPTSAADIELSQRFGLPDSERVVDSFSCALSPSLSVPLHGRLYISQHYCCFQGWRDSHLVLPFADVASVEKRTSALVLPNAIDVVCADGTVHSFVSFLYREDCFMRLQQMLEINRTIARLTSDAPGPGGALEEDAGQAGLERALDVELPLGVEECFDRLWAEPDFYADFLRAQGDSDVEGGAWSAEGERRFSYRHERSQLVGPRFAVTEQAQSYRWLARPDRFVVEMTTRFSEIPYADYFSVYSRWTFSSCPSVGACRCQVGVRVDFHKSTWLKGTIETGTLEETKGTFEAWAALVASVGGSVAPLAPESPPPPSGPPSVAARPRRPVVVAAVLVALIAFWLVYRVGSALQSLVALQEMALLEQREHYARMEGLLASVPGDGCVGPQS